MPGSSEMPPKTASPSTAAQATSRPAAVLLRRHGWNAEMVIGAQLLPFQSHAWVEIDGRVVNDKPYIAEIFQVLERC